ncbi:MAG: hypothetical protein ACOCUV_00400 [bacterium]
MKNINSRLAVSLPYLIVLAIFIGTIIAIISDRVDFIIRGGIVAVPALIAALLLKRLYKNIHSIERIDIEYLLNQKNCVVLFVSLYLISVILLLTSPIRSIPYFAILICIYTMVLMQIFSKNFNEKVILTEIVLCFLNIIYSVTLFYPLYFGGTDILPHLFAAKVTLLSGHTIPLDLSVGYAHFPLFHILVAISSVVFNIGITKSYFIIAAPIFAISIIFVHKIALSITNDKRSALLTALFFSTLSVVIYSGMYMVTRTMAFIGFVIILYTIYTNAQKNKVIYKIIGVIFVLFIILVHQVSTPQIVALLLLLLICESILNRSIEVKKQVSQTYLLLIIVGFIGYWIYTSYEFVQRLSTIYFDSTKYEDVVIKTSIQVGNEFSYIMNNIDYFIITLLVFIGIGSALYKNKKSHISTFALASVLILPLYIPNPLQLLWNTMTLFRVDRFMLLVSPFIAIMMAIGLIYLYKYMMHRYRHKTFSLLIVVLLFSSFIIPSIGTSSPEANYWTNSERRYFTDTELSGFQYISNHVQKDSILYSDYFSRRYFNKNFSKANDLKLSYYIIREIDIQNIRSHDGYLLLRKKAFFEYGLRLGSGDTVDIHKDEHNKWDKVNFDMGNKKKVYSSNDVELFR